jgi:hypothetical protein
MQPEEGGKKNVDAIALEDDVIADEESDSAEGDDGEELQAAAEQAWGERERHGAKVKELSAIGYGLSEGSRPIAGS